MKILARMELRWADLDLRWVDYASHNTWLKRGEFLLLNSFHMNMRDSEEEVISRHVVVEIKIWSTVLVIDLCTLQIWLRFNCPEFYKIDYSDLMLELLPSTIHLVTSFIHDFHGILFLISNSKTHLN